VLLRIDYEISPPADFFVCYLVNLMTIFQTGYISWNERHGGNSFFINTLKEEVLAYCILLSQDYLGEIVGTDGNTQSS
jgi:hypothetical protein